MAQSHHTCSPLAGIGLAALLTLAVAVVAIVSLWGLGQNLSSMAERARGIGASVDIESEPGRGTRVVVAWKNRKEGNHPG